MTNGDRWLQITEAEARAVYERTLQNELSGATKAVREFEMRWKKWTGARYALTTANGSSALFCAYFGLGIGPGDEVICPTYTWINSIGPALLLGARPVFCECDPGTLLLDPCDVRRKLSSRTRAIVAVHLWGHVCDMDALASISQETSIPIVEDCSHAPGASYHGRMVGRWGRVGCWSLQGSKPISAGEGGVLATDDRQAFERACLVSQGSRLGSLTLPEHALHQPLGLGMKLRAHPLGIAIAAIQLDRLPGLNQRRGAYIEAVEAGLEGVPGIRKVTVLPGAKRAGYYGFPVFHVAEEHHGLSTTDFIAALNQAGVAAAPADSYPLLHRLPLFSQGYDLFTRNRGPLSGDYPGYREGDFPHSEAMHRRLVFLPVLSDPAPEAIDWLVGSIRRVCEAQLHPKG
jgi:perosamine synthetase